MKRIFFNPFYAVQHATDSTAGMDGHGNLRQHNKTKTERVGMLAVL
jgi:hypothetical protein